MKKQTTDSDLEISRYKWTTFTYTGKETIYNTKLFKHTNIKIA
jgi:hypothetical protein